MSFRLIDLMCDRHRTLILDTRIWPAGYKAGNHNPGNNSCYDCGEVGGRQPTGTALMFPSIRDRRQEATHEAGHVVAGLAAGYRIVFASMESSGRPGSTAHFSAVCSTYQHGSSGHAVMALAGEAATRRWVRSQGLTSDANLIDAVRSGTADVEELFELGWTVTDLASRVVDADQVIDLHWGAIERVAAALLSAGRLDGTEIAEIAGLSVEVSA